MAISIIKNLTVAGIRFVKAKPFMKPLLYLFVLFVFIMPVTVHSGRGVRNRIVRPKRNELRKAHISPFPLEERGLTESSRQIQERLRENKGVPQTLQEAQDQLKNSRGTMGRKPIKSEQVVSITRQQTKAFTVADIQLAFIILNTKHGEPPPKISKGTIQHTLNKMTDSEELTLLQQGQLHPHSSNVWIRTKVLEKSGLTKEQALQEYYKASGLFKTEEIQQFVRTLQTAFTVADVQKQFSDFSDSDVTLNRHIIIYALNKMTASKELTLLRQGQLAQHIPSVWIKTEVLEKSSLTKEQILQKYYETSALYKIEKIQQFVRTLQSDFTISDILKENQFSDFPRSTIHTALIQMGEELTLLRRGSTHTASVWIRTEVLEKNRPTELKHAKTLNSPENPKTEQIQQFVRTLQVAFTVEYIKNQEQFSDFSRDIIIYALNRMDSKELILLRERRGSRRLNFNLWIMENALNKHIQLSAQTFTSAFTVTDIKERFPKLSSEQIYKALTELTDQRKISLTLENNQLKWIRTDLLSQKSVVQERSEGTNRSEEVTQIKAAIMFFIKMWELPFTITDIKERFSHFPIDQVFKALQELTAEGKINIILQNDKLKWIKANVLPEKGMTWEELANSRVEFWLTTHITIIKPFIIETNEAFDFRRIQNRFPNLSNIAIESVLKNLTDNNDLVIISGNKENRVWIRTTVLHERGLTYKDALTEYYEKHNQDSDSQLSYPQPLNETNIQVRNSSPNLKLILTANEKAVDKLFKFIESSETDPLPEEAKRAFKEVIRVHDKLGDAFSELTEEIIGENMPFLPKDALSMVWHTANLKKMVPEGQTLNSPKIENLVNDIIRFIDFIIREQGRDSINNDLHEELDVWSSYRESGETIFEQLNMSYQE